MVILSLGNGWYNLETCNDGPFFWSSDLFSIYVETPVLSLELYFNCNKLKTPYRLKYTTDDWNSEEVVELNHGTNSINLIIDGKKRIDFKCDYFIPSQTSISTDNRKLGIQLIRTLCKTIDGKCYEIDLNNVKSKFDVESQNSSVEIDKNCFKITLGEGWHDLEENRFRWSTGRGIIYVKDVSVKSIRINLSTPIHQKIIIKNNLNQSFEFDLEEGNQNISLKNIQDISFLEIISKPYSPSTKENVVLDSRTLGIQLYSIDVSYGDFDIKTYLMSNVFFEKDYVKLIDFLTRYNCENKLFHFNADGHVRMDEFVDNGGKFNLNDQVVFYTHRSGWAYAIDSIKSLHSDGGIRFEGFLERTFSWDKYKNIRNNVIPLKTPWVGVIHNPMLASINNKSDLFSSTKLFNSIVFQKSLETCKGLYVLSGDLKTKIKNNVNGVPVEFLYHPTETTDRTFTIDNYQKNSNKKIVSLGSWARRFLSIFLLKVPSHLTKFMVEPTTLTSEKFKSLLEIEKSEANCIIDTDGLVNMLGYLNSDKYDELLSENIMFMDFHDISASNLVIECIVRNTPILVRKHNAVVDYLGTEYPFYFETIQEASEKINDENLVEITYNYLTTLRTKKFLTKDYFLNTIKKGIIYNSL